MGALRSRSVGSLGRSWIRSLGPIRGKPVLAEQDENAPTKEENGAFEQGRAEPAPWPTPPWLAKPVASQSQPAPHG